MKAYDIYKRVLAIMFENEGEDKVFYEKFIEILNLLICEALPYENSCRASRGEEELVSAPTVETMEDEVKISHDICSVALPYGVAAYFSSDDGESYNAAMYRERYINALGEAAKHRIGDVVDVYGGERI
ncbi:MAG: hypothetical protein IJ299_05085 [Oscillospiraceae bacterium]|nr:hypothetical protein [Oscillospiraceae bacterium]